MGIPSGAITILAVLGWYGSNIGVLLLNKFLLSNTGFKQPVFLTLCHMVACVVLGVLLSATRLTPTKPVRSFSQLLRVGCLAAIFCLTVVLGNVSLKYIPISFNQAIGATTPFFTAIFAFFMQGTRESGITYFTLLPITAGVVIASGGEPLFHTMGLVFCLMATAGRAFKSVIQSILMSDPADKLDPMSLLLYMSMISVVLLLPTSLMLEPEATTRLTEVAAKQSNFYLWLLGNSVLAYAVNLTNFLVTKYTSALTLQVLGNAKGVIAAVVSVMVFANPVTWRGVVGYGVTVVGVILYSELRIQHRISAHMLQSKKRFKYKPLPTTEEDAELGNNANRKAAADDFVNTTGRRATAQTPDNSSPQTKHMASIS